MTKVLRASVGSAILLSTLLAACSGKTGDAVVTVNGQPISRSALNQRLKTEPDPKIALLGLVTDTLLDQYAQVNKITITDADIDARKDAIALSSPHLRWSEVVGNQNPTDAEIRDFIRRQLIIDRGVSYGIHVSPADVKAYYQQHRALFDKPGHETTLAQATPEINSLLRLQGAAPMSAGFIGNLITDAKIVVDDPRYANLLPTPPSAAPQ